MHELPPELTSAPFSVRDAVAAGVPPGALRRQMLASPFHGVRAPARGADGAADLEELCSAYLTRMPPEQHFSHLTAARLLGMRLPTRLDSDLTLDVTAVLPARAPRIDGVRGHSAERAEPRFVRGYPVAAPVDVWCSLATVLTVDELIVVADGLVSRRFPPASMSDLAAAVESHRGRRGAAALHRAVGQIRPGTDSARETLLRLLVLEGGLPEPEVNSVVSQPGEKTRYGDLVYRDWNVIVEYDGLDHSRNRATYVADITRAEQLRGWRTVTVISEHWADADRILARIEAALVAGGWRRPRSKRRNRQPRR